MKTNEVEKMLGITKQALIYYEKEGMIKPKRDENNYRCYLQEDIDILKEILLLRSMEITIDEIKLIINNELSIKDALKTKRESIQKMKIELDHIDKKIQDYIKRRKVKISFDNMEIEEWEEYDTLYFNENHIKYNEIVIPLNSIKNIDISMYSSIAKGKAGVGAYGIGAIYFQYYVDIDIYTNHNVYSFSILNNKRIIKMFDYMLEHHIQVSDPLQLIELYHEKTDLVQLNNYINHHFKEWAKIYHLDNPRDDFTYYHSMASQKENYNKKKDFFGLKTLKKIFK